jgi:hypothetical protein
LLADQPNGRVGMSWVFRIINTGAGALTPTADGGGTVTITGGAAIAQNTWSDYMMTINTATTATAQYIGNGVVV